MYIYFATNNIAHKLSDSYCKIANKNHDRTNLKPIDSRPCAYTQPHKHETLNIKPDMQNIPIFHNVILAFNMKFACIFHGLF